MFSISRLSGASRDTAVEFFDIDVGRLVELFSADSREL
jgi:hypothetical protein